jgi:hypothetical protein
MCQSVSHALSVEACDVMPLLWLNPPLPMRKPSCQL